MSLVTDTRSYLFAHKYSFRRAKILRVEMTVQSKEFSLKKAACGLVSCSPKRKMLPTKISFVQIALAVLLFFSSTFGARIPAVDKSNELPSQSNHQNEHRMHPKLDSIEPRINSEQLKLEKTKDYWLKEAQKFIANQNAKKLNKNVAKNIIFFLGDGMSMPTLAAVRPYLGGEEKSYSFEKFPSVGMSKTYCVNYQVADSATTATAYLNGVKANMGTIGVSAKVRFANCTESQYTKEYTTSIAKWALDAGKSAGIITTTRVTHASPAGCYAHTAERNWENDAEVKKGGCDPSKVEDIAKQLMDGDVGSKFQVILGGGRREFRDKKISDEVEGRGKRLDGRNMIDEWLKKNSGYDQRAYVWNTVSCHFDDTNSISRIFVSFLDFTEQY